MKNKILTLIFTLITSSILFAQATGDYRTASGGDPWDELIAGLGGNVDWEKYDGTSWVAADNSSDYLTTIPSGITVYINHPGITIISDAITIESGGKIEIAAGMDFYDAGKLTNNAGTGGIIIKANSSGVGQYKNKSDIQVTLQYYLSASSWHLIGVPFSGYSTTSTFDGAYLQQFDDSVDGNWIWNDEAGFDSSIAVGHGYSYWKSSGETYTFTGTADANDVKIDNIPNVDQGYVLLANPYICAVKYTEGWTLTNMSDDIYLWGEYGGSYGNYQAEDGHTIPTGSGFIMHTTASASLTIASADRVVSSTANPFKKETDNSQNYVRLVIENTNNNMADMLKLKFADNGTTNFDSEIDGEKIMGSEYSPDFYMLTDDDVAVSIKGIDANQASTVKLQLRPNVDATYRITATEFTFDTNTEILLEDLFTSSIMTVDKNLDYTFSSSASDMEDRFRIYVTPSANSIDNPNIEDQFKVFGSDNQLRILTGENNYKLMVYNLLGQKLVEKTNLQGNTELDLSTYKQKIVIVSIQTENQTISKKIQLR